jgi:hypothetical protein
MGQSTQEKLFLRDFFTNYPVTLSGDHTYIHQGKAFTISGKTGAIAPDGSYVIALTTPSTGYFHWRPVNWSSTANIAEMVIAKDAVVTAETGSELTARNRNHNSSKTSHITALGGVTLTDPGTDYYFETVGSGGGVQNRSGGSAGGADNEIVFDQSTTYAVKIKNIGTSTNTEVYYELFWYEEEQG